MLAPRRGMLAGRRGKPVLRLGKSRSWRGKRVGRQGKHRPRQGKSAGRRGKPGARSGKLAGTRNEHPQRRRELPPPFPGHPAPLGKEPASSRHPQQASIGVAGAIPVAEMAMTDIKTTQRGAHGVMGNLAFAAPDALQLSPMNVEEPGIGHIVPPVPELVEQRPEHRLPIESHARKDARKRCPFGGKVSETKIFRWPPKTGTSGRCHHQVDCRPTLRVGAAVVAKPNADSQSRPTATRRSGWQCPNAPAG